MLENRWALIYKTLSFLLQITQSIETTRFIVCGLFTSGLRKFTVNKTF